MMQQFTATGYCEFALETLRIRNRQAHLLQRELDNVCSAAKFKLGNWVFVVVNLSDVLFSHRDMRVTALGVSTSLRLEELSYLL